MRAGSLERKPDVSTRMRRLPPPSPTGSRPAPPRMMPGTRCDECPRGKMETGLAARRHARRALLADDERRGRAHPGHDEEARRFSATYADQGPARLLLVARRSRVPQNDPAQTGPVHGPARFGPPGGSRSPARGRGEPLIAGARLHPRSLWTSSRLRRVVAIFLWLMRGTSGDGIESAEKDPSDRESRSNGRAQELIVLDDLRVVPRRVPERTAPASSC